MNKIIKNLLITLAVGAAFGVVIAILSPGNFLPGWLAASLLSWFSFFFLLTAWEWSGRQKLLAWMMVLAFVLRMGIGVALAKGLPLYGYPEEAQWHGYVFRDAHERDIAAWNLASSEKPLWVSFKNEIAADQYGGLLSISAAIYRFLSPDAHRPFLVLILGAFMSSLAIPFLWMGLKQRWNVKIASLTCWIVLLYPDGILFGSSQMREPFMLGLSSIAFWTVLDWTKGSKKHFWIMAACAVGMLLISSRMALAILGFLAVWFMIEKILPNYKGKSWLLWGGTILAGAAFLLVSLGWFVQTSSLDYFMTEFGSGWVQKIIEDAGGNFRIPIITVYGLAQPVLPAAIAEPTIWIWKAIIIPRALGWYLLAPFLLYGMFSVIKARPLEDRRILLWLAGFLLVWLVISSARAGGDLWDNPRYRANFLPWFALLAAWAVNWAKEKRDPWLVRWLLVEVVFLGFFTNWYFSRYYLIWSRLPFWQTVMWILILSGLILAGGLVMDWIKKKNKV